MIKFTIPGQPQGKGRAKIVCSWSSECAAPSACSPPSMFETRALRIPVLKEE